MDKKSNKEQYIIIISTIVVVLILIFIANYISTNNSTSSKATTNDKQAATEETSSTTQEQPYRVDTNISNTDVLNKNFGDTMIRSLTNLNFTVEEATQMQSIFYKIGINSLSSIQEGAGDGIDKLQSFVACANNDTKKKFYFTVEKRKLFYAGFMDSTLYDTSKGGVLKNINDVHIPETKVDMNTYTTLQVKAQETVKQYLNYPDTANFPLYDGWGIARNDDNYKINGKVSAKNSFGVTSTMNFSVYFRKSNNNYSVEAVQLNGVRVK